MTTPVNVLGLVATSSGEGVVRYPNQLMEIRSKPRNIVCGNGTEFTCKAMYFWCQEKHVKLEFIQPGKSRQNVFAESFSGKFGDTCLNQY